MAVNSAALPEQLVESELFGHERGPLPAPIGCGGVPSRMPALAPCFSTKSASCCRCRRRPSCCASSRTARSWRVGGDRPIPIAASVVAATNRDLEREVDAGRFRQDLLYRLNIHTLRVPPLRDRLSDIPAIVDHLLQSIASHLRMRPKTIAPDAVALLAAHDWRKNNVRELSNACSSG